MRYNKGWRRPGAEPTVASLYSGCGGFDKGFQQLGFQSVGAFDIDPRVVDVFNCNGRAVARVVDLMRANPDVAEPEVLLAGSPCQGFSTSGKRIVGDPRNQLLVRAGYIALLLRPRVFILENVPAVLSGTHSDHWRLVEDMLRWNGYNVRRFLAEGKDSGIAQLRRRLFLVAWKGSDCIRVEPFVRSPITLANALVAVDLVPDHDPLSLTPGSREALIARRIKAGCKVSNVRAGNSSVHTWEIPEVYGTVNRNEVTVLETLLLLRRRDRRRDVGDADPVLPSALRHALGWNPGRELIQLVRKGYLRHIGRRIDLVHTYNGKFRRLRWDAPSPTVDTHFGDPALFLHPDEHRGFTPREAARIQGFPDDFVFIGSRRARFRMIGNAVPPPMAARLAEFVRAALL